MKLVTVTEMRHIEQEADGNGLTYAMMMENAGTNLARELQNLVYEQDGSIIQVLGLVGPGNNGGDTLVALTRLAEKGWKTRGYLVRRQSRGDDLIGRLEKAGGEVCLQENDQEFQNLATFISTSNFILDGVLGTGFKLPLKEEVGSVLAAVKRIISSLECPPVIVAVDCPSGIDCDTGQAAVQTIRADVTITMGAAKQGFVKCPSRDLLGELRVVEIGRLDEIRAWQEICDEVADPQLISSILPVRPVDAHKGTFGTAFIIAGSINYTGAALLAGKAAYRSGAGLVTMAIPSALHTALAGHFPEATWVLLPNELGVISSGAADVVLKNLERATALLVGPGLGLEDTTKEFISNLLKGNIDNTSHGRMGFVQGKGGIVDLKPVDLPPMVFDADGLKLLAKIPDWPKVLPAPAILTPHPGEMSALTGLTIEEIQKDRLAVARTFARQWGHVVVLKGAYTVIASPDGRLTIIPVASSALARAGTGDVLAGLITGLRAQGVSAYDSARAGAFVHAQAGLIAANNLGGTAAVMAGDVLGAVPEVLTDWD
jgi:ADP-dependent NAD(P)H-hydrate dehydratase / NAD(P)H-hydrate epimerase